jgi:hemerythrin-like domain-containing protein
LIDHIVNTHHDYLYKELPVLSAFITKVLHRHGMAHPELANLHQLFHDLKNELEQHLTKEEQEIFPLIKEYEKTGSREVLEKAVQAIEQLEEKHNNTGNLLKQMRQVTNHYELPEGACQTYTLSYIKLEQLESDLFQHIHLENNVMFPRLTQMSGPERKIVKNGSIWSSSKGILGADDRAGVAVLLEIAKWLETSDFNGTIKFVFTIGEECGLIGARELDEYFLWGVDAAIVVDRRGTGDIVTSYGTIQPFCDIQYGQFFEKVAKDAGLTGWKCTSGGSSDTRIWAERGIQSVNLSVGYSMNTLTRKSWIRMLATIRFD